MRQLKISRQFTNREHKSLDKYLSDISRVPMISPDEEVDLAQRIREGDQAALEKLVNANLRFVVSVSKQYQNQGLVLGDLINEGNLGLIKAAQRFDETRGFKFISYAVWWIRQSILQAIADQARLIRLPLNKVGSLSKIMQIWAELEQKLEREPTPEEIADKSEMSLEEVETVLKTSGKAMSLDAPLISEGENNFTLMDTVEQSEYLSTDDEIMRQSLKDEIAISMSMLDERQRDVLKYYFGLDGHSPYSLEAIAEKLGLTRERARQIKEGAVKRLKKSSRSEKLKMYLG